MGGQGNGWTDGWVRHPTLYQETCNRSAVRWVGGWADGQVGEWLGVCVCGLVGFGMKWAGRRLGWRADG